MNTANLQLQGLLAVLSSLLQAMEQKGGLSRAEIETALDRAEAEAADNARNHHGVSEANIDAVRFPARYLRQAIRGHAGGAQSFGNVATAVGQTKSGTSQRGRKA